jgi:hypothetical protein
VVAADTGKKALPGRVDAVERRSFITMTALT